MPAEKVAFITVNYRRTGQTVSFVESLSRLDGFSGSRVVIVDNETSAQSERELEGIRAAHPENVTVLHSGSNLFYWGAAAHALRSIYGEAARMPEWLIVCNNDIVVEQKDFIKRLEAKDHKKYGVIAPSIISVKTGRDQNPGISKPYTHLHLLYWKIFYANYHIARLMYLRRELIDYLGKEPEVKKAPPQGKIIYAPQGAFMILSRLFFERGGYFDTNFELFNEELAIAEMARMIGLDVHYDPLLKVLHDEHSTTGASFTRKKYFLSKKSYNYIKNKYFTRFKILKNI